MIGMFENIGSALDHAPIEVLARRDGGRVEQRRFGSDLDLLAERAHLQRERQGQLLCRPPSVMPFCTAVLYPCICTVTS